MDILLIEDDPTDRKLLTAVLKTSGNRVLEHGSAEEAFAAIKAHRPQLILVDLKLPGLDGLALTRRLKNDPETSAIPIVAVTAAPERFSREDALAAGCDAYIRKPIDTRKLPEQIAEVARQSGRGLGRDYRPGTSEETKA
jgi:CheY-like chemotaxis protein